MLKRCSGVLLVVLAVSSLVVVGGPAVRRPAGADETDAGQLRVPEADWIARTDDYLAWATGKGLNPGSVSSIMAHAERARREPGFVWDANAPSPATFAGSFDKLANFRDTGDFTINDFLFLLYRYRDDLRPDLVSALEQRILDFKYWWTEPTPPGIVDSQYYWTENHLIIFLADEYLAGQAFPTEVFSNSGMTGADHMAHAKPLIMRWLSLRARFGFSEWLSNVYWMEDLKGLLLLAEHADDPELAGYASMMLDVLFVELASHLHNGAFGSTHGRSYQKDKLSARTEDTFTMAKMVFDDTAFDYQGVDTTSLLATATRYRPPQVARAIAADTGVTTVRQHQSLPIDPEAPITDDPPSPYGLGWDDPMVWWSMGGQFPWQVVPLSIELIETYDLFETSNFQQVADLRPIVESSTVDQLRELARTLAVPLNPGLLSSVDTTTWRSPEVMLSSAQDWRKGERSEQAHIWQATLDADAQVFTTHPRSGVPLIASYDGNGGYWTGEGALPRTGQVDNVAVSIYQPRYESADDGPIAALRYEPYTHAYFPTERFDEVVEQDGWVIGRRGDGYVALWSWRPTTWRAYDPGTEVTFGLTERFDLLAPGGPENVWITEVARAADFAGATDPFAAFVAAITAAAPTVTPLGPGAGFDVAYPSPTRGPITYGWEAPLTAGGAVVPQHDFPRWSSPWAEVPWDTWVYRITAGGQTITLDFTEVAQLTVVPQVPTPPTGTAPAVVTPAFTG